MSSSTAKNSPASAVQSLIAEVVGTKPVLPGESPERYAQALAQIVTELEAKGPLQVYLAEKILDCLWWIRRYEDQKRLLIAREMAEVLHAKRMLSSPPKDEIDYLNLLLHHSELPEFRELLKKMGFTLETLRERALYRARLPLQEFDKLIAMQGKALEGFQKSYEHVSHRKLHAERLALSLEMLRRDAKSIDVKALNDGVAETDSR
jgi:hypothetical protein